MPDNMFAIGSTLMIGSNQFKVIKYIQQKGKWFMVLESSTNQRQTTVSFAQVEDILNKRKVEKSQSKKSKRQKGKK